MKKKRFTVILIIGLMLMNANFVLQAAEPAESVHHAVIELVPREMRNAADTLSITESDAVIRIESDGATPTAESNAVIPTVESDATDAHMPLAGTTSSASNLSAAPIDLWERIRKGFTMAELDSEEVRNSEDFYASHPEYIKRVVERGKRYLFHIVEEVERRGMPAEIALLPIIESAFNPKAYSSRHASGIWQFSPSTGRNYGLKQNWWYDDRRDIIAATNAALDYLESLHGMFDDWELVFASYNWGEGAVGRSLMKNRSKGLPADFRNISLPPETQSFVSRVIAIRNIISNPAAFGIELESVPNEPYFEIVPVTRHIDIKLAAKLAGISVDEFKALNPAHNRPVVNTDGSRTLLFPADKVEIFTANLKNHDKPLVSWRAYRAKKGETVEKISARYGISVGRLQEVNDIDKNTMIMPGQTLLVPHNGSAGGEDISIMSNKPATLKLPEHSFVYAVQKGDSLFRIAKRHGVTAAQIKSWNGSTNRLLIGQKLILKHHPADKTTAPSPESPEGGTAMMPEKKRM
ncbi:LysM peptidoglycan-binding domain-containing protein [Nitrosovibrio sp. Nv6]|uniref:LysM peptidoglycan-binding domain-containing protein n=1 Tax=Nitrosovibrio sp. Nv6 TaxID=1855340 RepID=UPI0008B64406|nr:LysM peptidoglycan-binding domain-containing protein [Nitrosovibrio sp. Nv6]SEP32542.1 membrane-bound lytic murein transglycosylase D [Nitrosovibrio sp. Nv6]